MATDRNRQADRQTNRWTASLRKAAARGVRGYRVAGICTVCRDFRQITMHPAVGRVARFVVPNNSDNKHRFYAAFTMRKYHNKPIAIDVYRRRNCHIGNCQECQGMTVNGESITWHYMCPS